MLSKVPFILAIQPSRFYSVRDCLVAGLFGVLVLAASPGVAAEKTAWFSDIPVIADTQVNAQLSFAFDSPSGRILVLYLESDVPDAELRTAYTDAFSAIGWSEQNGRLVKGAEQLRLEKIEAQNKMYWRLTLLPAAANQLEIR